MKTDKTRIKDLEYYHKFLINNFNTNDEIAMKVANNLNNLHKQWLNDINNNIDPSETLKKIEDQLPIARALEERFKADQSN